jgi:hypothetical protein
MKKIYLLIFAIAAATASWAQCTVTTTQTNVSCFGGSNGTATANPSGGVPPYTFSWAPGGQTTQTATGLAPGTYTVTVADAAVCNVNATVTITEPSAALSLTTAGTNITCMGGNDGTATATVSGGTPPYSYSWNSSPVQTTQTAVNLPAGTYAVAIVDANGCTASGAVTLTQPSTGISATASVISNVSCNAGMDGAAVVMATNGTGPLTYMWNDPASTGNDTLAGTGAGSYIATVTDSLGCSDTAMVTITEPSAIITTTMGYNASCFGLCDGLGAVSVNGGTPPYNYIWSNGWLGASDSNLCAGSYTVSITDSMGCNEMVLITISEPSEIMLSLTATNPSCVGCANGSATVAATGGTGSYTYLWLPGNQTTATAAGLAANTYTVCVTDVNGCQMCDTITLVDPNGIAETGSMSYLLVAPNPAKDAVTVSMELENTTEVLITVSDITGRAIITRNQVLTAGSGSATIAVDILPVGVYFVSVAAEGKTVTKRFVKL